MKKRTRPSAALDRLESILDELEPSALAEKRALLEVLERARLPAAREVQRLHEALLVLRAYPDDEAILGTAGRMLAGFSSRRDVRRFSAALASSGIAGAPIDYSFYWSMAEWLADRWPDRLVIDWPRFTNRDRLEEILHLLVPPAELQSPPELSLREWLAHLAGASSTDAAFLVRRFAKTKMDAFAREKAWDGLDVALRLRPGPAAPSRTTCRWPVQKIVCRANAPALSERARFSMRELSPEEGSALIDLLRESMVTRSRDLEAIAYANAGDAVIAEFEDGLAFAGISMIPERRFLLETLYVFAILRNGVPVGYFQATALFRTAELNYNIFPPFRGREARAIYLRGISVVRRMLGVVSLAVDPYQLGCGNPEALRSGAFWFYYKLGYRPDDEERLKIVAAELAAKRRDPAHRSSRATLAELANGYVRLDLRGRRDEGGRIDTGAISLRVSDLVAKRFASDREHANQTLSREACAMLGVRSLAGRTPSERAAWERWAPLVAVLPAVIHWTATERRTLAELIFAKGGRRERDYAMRLARCDRLRRSLVALCGAPRGRSDVGRWTVGASMAS